MSTELTQKEIDDFRYGIVRVKVLSFFMNESVYVHDPTKQVKVEMSHLFGTNVDAGLIDFRLRIYFYYPERNDQILADITVQNVFSVLEFKKYTKGNINTYPSQFLISMVSMAISHGRALFSHNLAGSAFQDFMLPVTNPIDAAKHFFPSMYIKETGEIKPSSSLEKIGIKL